MLALLAGCGSTKSYTATDQLLMSDAVDATVAQLDFSPLSDHKVYLDTTYLKTQKGQMLIDSDYVISSLRQQMMHAGVFLVDNRDEADIIAEARMGALGLDSHSVSYGVPANSSISNASSVLTNTPLPTIPEMSLARHEAKSGAAKIAVFAYERDTKLPYWQSGIAKSSSSARDTWVLGAGPWQRGTIYDSPRFAGTRIDGSALLIPSRTKKAEKEIRYSEAFQEYRNSQLFDAAKQELGEDGGKETQIAEGEESVILTGAAKPADDS